MIRGVDIASFQGLPGEWRAKAGAFDFAAVKLTELGASGSKYVNPDAADDWSYLGQQKKIRLAYAFGHPSTLPSATVALLASALGPLGLQDGDGVALDLENTDGLAPAEVASYARATTAAMRALFGRAVVLYSDLAFFEAGNCEGCGSCLGWIADISRPAGLPRVPSPFKSWAIHQWSWSPLDEDVANFASPAAMRAAIGKAAPPKPRAIGDDAMLLNRGAGAVTPFPVAEPANKVRVFCAEGTAELTWNLVGEPVHVLKLTPASSEVITLPAGKHAVRFVRVDGGGNDVAAVAEA
jgi:lysozyme